MAVKYRHSTIRQKLLYTFVGLIVVLVVTLTALELVLQTRAQEKELTHQLDVMKENLLERGNSLSVLLLSQVESLVEANNVSAIRKLLENAIEQLPLFEYAILVDNTGLALLDTLHPEQEQSVLTDMAAQYALAQDSLSYREYPDSQQLEYILPVYQDTVRRGVLRLGFTLQPLLLEMARSREQRDSMTRQMILISCAMAGVFIVLGWGMVVVLSTTLTRPLMRLTQSVRDMAQGHYVEASQRLRNTLEISPPQGEIGVLAAAFIDMADEVHRARNTLEEKVKDRTLELEQAYTRLQELDQLKTRFLSTVSHELRTPLTSVLGFAQIIQKKSATVLQPVLANHVDPKVAKAMRQVLENTRIIIEEGERLTSLINDVLDLAKLEAGRVEWSMQSLSIADLVDRAMTATAGLFVNKPLDFRKEVAPDLPGIQGDRDRLLQVLINLIANAVKFTEQGSITCRASVSGNTLTVSVIDTGCGIRPEDQALVFETFKQVGDTLTDKPQGTGLGLPICKEIIEHHGGRLWVESEPGVGSTFGFTLLLAAD